MANHDKNVEYIKMEEVREPIGNYLRLRPAVAALKSVW